MDSFGAVSRPGLTPENWAELKLLFERALELGEGNHSEVLTACPSSLRASLDELLRLHREQASLPTRPLLSQSRILEYFQAGVQTFGCSDLVCGRFRVERLLGEGGMGEVYAASDLELGETVAIKTLRPHICGDPRMVAYFRQEIHLARRVTHPNVCRTYDIFQHQVDGDKNILVLSMEYLEGRTLLDCVRQDGAFKSRDAWPIIEQIGQALTSAHNSGVVHRDLKSSNIILVREAGGRTRAVVTDFGLAHDQLNSAGTLENNSDEIVGTPSYMAPEQIAGLPATSLVDIYAFGVVLYEMLTGKLPFACHVTTRIACARTEERPLAPRELVPSLSAKWSNTILRCLDENPAKRPQTVEEVCDALSQEHFITRRWFLGTCSAAILGLAMVVRPRAAKQNPPVGPANAALKRAQEFARRRNQEGLENAIAEYREVLNKEPTSVDAWTGLADAYSAMANFHFVDPQHGFRAAQDAAHQALKLDSSSGRAHGVLAYCESNDLHEWLQAEPHFKEAIRFAPTDPEIRLWYGAHLGKLGRTAEAIQQLKIGLQEDPASLALNQQLATEYFLADMSADFERQARELVRLQPFEATSHLMLARSLEEQGRYEEALQSCRKAEEYQISVAALCVRGSIEARRGNRKTAKAIALQVEQYWRKNPFDTLLLAALYCRLGDTSRGVDILLAGCDRNDSSVLLAPHHPHLVAIRQDSRYPSFLARIGLSS